jgi:acetolactate synthase small subunit
MTKEYTLTVFTEHQTGMLSRVVSIFTRRYIIIESLSTSHGLSPPLHHSILRLSAISIKIEVQFQSLGSLNGNLKFLIERLSQIFVHPK